MMSVFLLKRIFFLNGTSLNSSWVFLVGVLPPKGLIFLSEIFLNYFSPTKTAASLENITWK